MHHRSALAFITLAEGIPIVYYGTEAHLTGRVDHDGNRGVLSQERDMGATMRDMDGVYLYIKKLNWRVACPAEGVAACKRMPCRCGLHPLASSAAEVAPLALCWGCWPCVMHGVDRA